MKNFTQLLTVFVAITSLHVAQADVLKSKVVTGSNSEIGSQTGYTFDYGQKCDLASPVTVNGIQVSKIRFWDGMKAPTWDLTTVLARINDETSGPATFLDPGAAGARQTSTDSFVSYVFSVGGKDLAVNIVQKASHSGKMLGDEGTTNQITFISGSDTQVLDNVTCQGLHF